MCFPAHVAARWGARFEGEKITLLLEYPRSALTQFGFDLFFGSQQGGGDHYAPVGMHRDAERFAVAAVEFVGDGFGTEV